jgi:hypothetical protein
MTLIRALPDEFNGFALSLLLLDKLEKSTIHQAFVTEESQHSQCTSATPNVGSALAALLSSSAASSMPECSFCGMKWHIEAEYHKYLKSKQDAQHHSHAMIRKLIQGDLVTGLVVLSKDEPDPICKACLAGKMTSRQFPSSSRQSLALLELIHSDLHGPLPVPSPEGYHYWIMFLDDRTKLHAVHFLKRKSDTFDMLKTFKAYAENQVNAKIKALQDDKGGEYMSAAFLKFTDQCGITRRHSTRDSPQQNGVAERANHTISDHATAMLNESNLPASFWVYAVSAYVHVWNRIPTSPLPGTTPYTAWFNKKLDISHFRVFGCTAYVYIQRDQRKSLQLHMEKCIFVGYPSGYKGWQFYNPVTRKFIISERAIFDERSFPGLKGTSPVNPTPVGTPVTFPDIPDSGGDDNFIPEPEIAPIKPDALPQPLLAPNNIPADIPPPDERASPKLEQPAPELRPHGPEHIAPPPAPPRAQAALLWQAGSGHVHLLRHISW